MPFSRGYFGCRSGETGRHVGLKILCFRLGGSIPLCGTIWKIQDACLVALKSL